MHANRIKNLFAVIARHYDFLNSLLSLRRDTMWRRETVKASHVTPTSKVLDVCTGTGELALAYAAEIALGQNAPAGEAAQTARLHAVNESGIVIGSDFCLEMLVVGNQKVSRRGTRAPFIAADTFTLPFLDNTFDIVSVGFGIRNVANAELARNPQQDSGFQTDITASVIRNLEMGIREMTRVAVPGGRIAILEFTQPVNPVFRRFYYFYFTKILPFIGNLISRNKDDAYGYLPRSVLRFPNCDALKEVMEKCGLTDVQFCRKTFGIVAIHVGKKL